MKAQVYGEATYEAIRAGTDPKDAFARLRDVLASHGRPSLYKAALQDTMARFQKDESQRELRVTIAKEKDALKYKSDIAAFAKDIDASEVVIRVDERIIGGYVATGSTKQRDMSHKQALLNIYKSLTA